MGVVFFMAFLLLIAITLIVLSITVIVIWYIRKYKGKNPRKGWRIIAIVVLIFNILVVVVPVVFIGIYATSTKQSESITIDGVTYRSGFYDDDLWPVFGEVGDIGSEALQKETIYRHGKREFRRVNFTGHNWVHSYAGEKACGVVYCDETQWEQEHAFYLDYGNYNYYVMKEYDLADNILITDIDPQKFDELLSFAKDSRYKPFGSNRGVDTHRLPFPDENISPRIKFFRESKDGFFTSTKGDTYYIIDGKLLLVIYYDYGHGKYEELVAAYVPDDLGQYFVNLVARYPK